MKRTIRATAPIAGALIASGPPAGTAHANTAHVPDNHDLPTGVPEQVPYSPDN
ncbi:MULTISPECIES: hypothetical protein [unclassified Streptomyces]|jgi:hypothetical protein|uniref:Uncharacterized protein n=1 Tax=Streptomyces sp. NBC_01393 TaxID=2903851 RepID=A0AAU3I6T7_9ACTN|nr:hypothetical protein [Streptomyces sp. NBC_00151]WRZ37734.1 hypothetical protein OG915_06540 [Streptomyces sp. NBC_00151]